MPGLVRRPCRSVIASSVLAMPKSSTLTKSLLPSRRMRNTFSGLRSRWRMPALCAAISAWQISRQMRIARSTGSDPASLNQVRQIGAVEILHHEINRAVDGGAGVEHVDDVRVADARCRPCLRAEARHHLALAGVGGVQDLDRHAAADLDVLGLEHLAHAAFADAAAHQVAPVEIGADHAAALGRLARLKRDRGRLRRGLVGLAFHFARRAPGAVLIEQHLARRAFVLDLFAEQPLEKLRHGAVVGGGCRLSEKAGQRRAERLAVGVAQRAILGQRLHDDGVERRGHARGERRRRLRLGIAHPLDHVLDGVGEHLPPGEQLPQDDPDRVQVGAPVERLALGLLRRHIANLAEHDARRGLLRLECRRRQAEVGQLHLAEIGEEHVGRRDVAVHQLERGEGVRVMEPARQLSRHVDRHVDGEGDAFLGAGVPHRAQIFAVDQLHRHEQLLADEAGVEHGDDVAVREAHHHLRLVFEARRVLLVGELRQHRLDDAQLLHARVAAAAEIQRAHAALGHVAEQRVVAELPREICGHGAKIR